MGKPRKATYLRYNRTAKGRFRNGFARAKKKGFSWTLAFTEYKYLIDNPCHYCGAKLDECGTGLDRMDSKRGYERENVVACCGQCNRLKGDDLSEKDMKLIRKIMKFVKEQL